jgi:hypothetical protein
MTPLHTLVADKGVSNILGQSTATFNPRELLEPGRITLLNASGMALLPEMRRWLAALLADRINLLVMERQATSEVQPTPLVVAVNERLLIPYLDDPEFLTDLQKRGARYILPYDFVRHQETKGPGLPQALLENATSLFVFCPTGYDAKVLCDTLGEFVSARDLVDLPYHACYVRTLTKNQDVLVERITTAPPLKHDRRAVERTLARIKSFARSAADVGTARKRFVQRWHGDEVNELLERAKSRTDDGSTLS